MQVGLQHAALSVRPFIIKWGRGTYERLFVKREEPGYFFLSNDSLVCFGGVLYIYQEFLITPRQKKKTPR